MYRPLDLKTGLSKVWGWKQNQNTSVLTISDSLTESESGQYYQELHPVLTLENIRSIAPDFQNITYPTWNPLTQYRVGDRVKSVESYRAKLPSLGKDPLTNTNEWERFDPFSEWLEEKTQGSILKAIRNFWDSKMSEKTAKNILENKTLFNGAGRLTDTIPEGTNFVGFELVPIRANGVTLKIEKIGLQFTDVGEITLYLMHSSREQPIKEFTLTRTRKGGMEWFDMTNLFLPYQNSDIDSGGSWYLVYDQASLPSGSLAISKSKDWSARPCASCDASESANYAIWSRYLEVHPFKISDVVKTPAIEMWSVEDNLYTYTTNYGLNLQLSIECDVTDIIIEQRMAFQNIIGLQVAVDMLREMAFNPNANIGRAQQNFNRMELLYELDGDSQGTKKSGLMFNYDNDMKAVQLDSTSMSRVCFPCNNGGVKYRTI